MVEVRLSTNRLILRRVRERDRGAILAYATLPDAAVRQAFDGLPSVDEMRRQATLRRPGDILSLAVDGTMEGRLIGLVRLHWDRSDPLLGTLQFVFDPAFAHRGYCIEALQAVMGLAFLSYPIEQLTIEYDGTQKTDAIARGMLRLGLQIAADGERFVIARDRWSRAMAA